MNQNEPKLWNRPVASISELAKFLGWNVQITRRRVKTWEAQFPGQILLPGNGKRSSKFAISVLGLKRCLPSLVGDPEGPDPTVTALNAMYEMNRELTEEQRRVREDIGLLLHLAHPPRKAG